MINFKEIDFISASILGFVMWLVALIYSIIIMSILGVDYTDPDVSFGLGHEKYWEFEAIMTPSYIVFGMLILILYFRWRDINIDQSWGIGIIIMTIQFVLDIIVIVFLFQSGFSYFVGLVTLTYLTIPFWSFLSARIANRIWRN